MNIIRKDIHGFPKQFSKIMKEMCKRVGANYLKINFNEEGWQSKYTWSDEDRQKFKKWVYKFIHENKELGKEVESLDPFNTNSCEEHAVYFVYDFGWDLDKLTEESVKQDLSELAKIGRI